MLSQGPGFAKYSKALCWVMSLIWLLLSVVAFTGDSESATLNGLLAIITAKWVT